MKIRYIVLAAALMLAGCAKDNIPQSVSRNTETADSDDGSTLRGWVRIKLLPDAQQLNVGAFTRGTVQSGNSSIDRIASEMGATEIRRVFNDGGKFAERRRRAGLHLWYDIKIDDSVPVSRATAALDGLPGVAHVQPVYLIKMADTFSVVPADYVYSGSDALRRVLSSGEMPFNDPELHKQWHYYNDGSISGSRAGADINLFEGWQKFNAGNKDVIVAVLDQGVDVSHEDLAANMWINEAEYNGLPGVDDDNNGYVDDVYGYNFENETGTMEVGNHGTHVAGTISAVNNNGVGVCGVAGGTGNNDGVRIMGLQVNPGEANLRYLDAFLYAADNGAVIASNSWASDMDFLSQDIAEAIDYFNKYAGTGDPDGNIQTGPMKGGLCMFAAGNYNGSGSQYVGRIFYPAADSRVIGVAAIAVDYKKASYSQYGQGVDVVAPGGDNDRDQSKGIYSTIGGGYGYVCGTSMATPHVSGVAALIVSQYGTKGPGFTSADLRRILTGSCRNIGEYQDKACVNGLGAGLVDVARMGFDADDPGKKPEWNGDPVVTGINEGLTFSCKVPADGNGDAVTWLFINVKRKDGSDQASELRYGFNSKVGETFTLTLDAVGDKEYSVEMYLQDKYGNKSETFTVDVKALPHINRPPQLRMNISDVMISMVDESLTRKLEMSAYFKDSDVGTYGDVLTYTVTQNTESSVADLIIDKSVLSIRPENTGETKVTVRATDIAGEFAEASFTVQVLYKPFADLEIAEAGKANVVKLGLSDALYSPGSNVYSVRVTSSDDSVVSAFAATGQYIQITPLKKGTAIITVSIKASSSSINPFVSTFKVDVLNDEVKGGATGASVSLYPSPAISDLNIYVPNIKASSASVVVYDSAGRQVKSMTVAFDANGVAVMNVAAMSPGTYSLAVSHNGVRYRESFIKK